MRRLAVVLPLLVLAPVWGQGLEVPEQVRSMYEGLCNALAGNDLDAARGFLTQAARLSVMVAANGQPDHPMRLPELYKIESLTPTFTGCTVKGERALVEYDLKLVGTDRKTGEKTERSWHQADALARGTTGWMILHHSRVDPDRQKREVAGNLYRNEEMGVAAQLPDGWRSFVPMDGGGAILYIVSPDLLGQAALVAADLPSKVGPKEVAQSEVKMGAALGLKTEVVSEAETTLAGHPAYQVTLKASMPEATTYSQETFGVHPMPDGDVLYGLVLVSEKADPAAELKAEAQLLNSTLKLTGPKPRELPPELGKVVDGKYVNGTYGVSMALAPGWKPRISKSRFLFQVSLAAPEGTGSLLLAGVDAGQFVASKLVAQSDLQTLRGVDPSAKVLGEGERDCAGTAAYQMLLQFTTPGAAAGAPPRMRWALYCSRGTRIYFLVGDAPSLDEYEKVKDDWGKMVDSLAWLPEGGG